MSSGAELLRRTLIGASQTPRRTEHPSRSRTKPDTPAGVVVRRQLKVGFSLNQCVLCHCTGPPLPRHNALI